MKRHGLVLIPYFGKLPNTFPFWARSAAYVRQIEWLLVTDSDIPCELPPNVKVNHCYFADVQQRIRSMFPYTVRIDSPWGLCAFRPAYGEIFAEEFSGYDFWGYGDLDVVYGNLDKYLSDQVFASYDKIFRWGHLSLIRNNAFGRTVYARQLPGSRLNCRDAFNGGVACFDERMFNELVAVNDGRIDDSQPIADFHHRQFQMQLWGVGKRTTATAYRVREPENKNNVFSWDERGLFRHFVNTSGVVETEEFAYIHFCRRPMRVRASATRSEGFGIIPNSFVTKPLDYDATYILNNSKNHIYWDYILPRLAPRRLIKRICGKRSHLPEK